MATQLDIATDRQMTLERLDTVVIGAGQAGLSVAYHLARRGQSFVVLEAMPRIGDVWRRRFDSLRLYTPARFNGLPGMRFPAPRWSFPGKDAVADFLEAYAERFELPVVCDARVEELRREGDGFLVRTPQRSFVAASVVVASGTWQEPVTPAFAPELDAGIVQMHSDSYRNPSQLQPGPVLVVGASHSGSDIALEAVKAGHPTILSGRVHGEVPFNIEGRFARLVIPVAWFAANHVLTRRTPMGRKVAREVRSGGGPLLRVRRRDLAAAGVEHTEARVKGVSDGRPVLDDGRVLDVANVVWCTGFHKDTSWIGMPIAGEDGWPEQRRGVSGSVPGLYFVGLPFLQAFASMLVGGVGRDAGYVARKIARRGAVVSAA